MKALIHIKTMSLFRTEYASTAFFKILQVHTCLYQIEWYSCDANKRRRSVDKKRFKTSFQWKHMRGVCCTQ